jgi:hypothetical protein
MHISPLPCVVLVCCCKQGAAPAATAAATPAAATPAAAEPAAATPAAAEPAATTPAAAEPAPAAEATPVEASPVPRGTGPIIPRPLAGDVSPAPAAEAVPEASPAVEASPATGLTVDNMPALPGMEASPSPAVSVCDGCWCHPHTAVERHRTVTAWWLTSKDVPDACPPLRLHTTALCVALCPHVTHASSTPNSHHVLILSRPPPLTTPLLFSSCVLPGWWSGPARPVS